MKKILCSVLLLCFLISASLSLVSCHGKKALADFKMPEDFDTDKKYSISFWAKNDNNRLQQDIYRKAEADFEKIYPNIDVTIRMFSDYNEIYKNVITNIQTSTTPNVCISYPDHIATYNNENEIVVSLDELMNDTRYGLGGSEIKFDAPSAEDIIPAFLEEGKINGKNYALPFMRSTEACYINVDMVKKLGYDLPDKLTWDFIWEVSEAALLKNSDGTYKVNGQNVLIPFIYKSTDNMMIQLLKQNGAGYSSENGDVLMFNDTAKEILYAVSEHTESGAFSTFKISSYPGNYMNAGQCIFAIDSTAGATWMGPEAPNIDIADENLVDFEIEVMPIPQVNHEEPKMISQGPSICIFNKEDSGEVVASWLFAQYLLTNEVQIAYSTTEGYVPVTKNAQESAEYLDYLSREGEDNDEHYDVKIKASKILIENAENTFITPVFNGSASVRNAAGQMIEEVAKATERGKEVDDDYLKKLFSDVSSLYHLDGIGAVGSSDAAKELGPMPRESVILLSSIGAIWLILGAYMLINQIKKRNKS